MSVTIYHNPRCSKSRRTLELLGSRELDLEVVEYLKNPPAAEELERILNLLGIEPRDLMRTNEAPYKDMNLGDSALSRSELIAAMRQHPILIQRPIVLANGRAAIGRPPEQVLGLL
jgi:arsenate reductase